MYTLGINAVFHDPAACLVKDGDVLSASEEERFTHIKHGKRPVPFSTWELPFHAIDDCLKQAGITLSEVQHVAYSFDPDLLLNQHLKDGAFSLPKHPVHHSTGNNFESPWDPLFLLSIVNAPNQLVDGAPHHLQERFIGAKSERSFQWHWVKHHIAHSASAYLASPFERCAVLTLDGRGEKATTTYGVAEGTHLEVIGQVDLPHSLCLLYEQVTEHLGFLRSSDEYKVMALASYGAPVFAETLRNMIRISGSGQYTISAVNMHDAFGPARKRGGPLESWHYNLAHSLQLVFEETVLKLARWLQAETGERNLVMAGGGALNCVMNARLQDKGPFDQVWVQPAAGDAGTALGAALWVDARERGTNVRKYHMTHAYLGPHYSDEVIEQFLTWTKIVFRKADNVPAEAAQLLASGKIIGWYQGRLEFGPRALGARSILASPIPADMQARLNEIKDREDFRPVAPVILEEDAAEWFVGASRSPFMLFVYDVKPEKAQSIPAVRHVDGTARIQTIHRDQHPLYYDLIRRFKEITGVPILVNTSFNTRGEPIVCTPRDAVESFWTSPLDALVIGPYILEK